MVLFPQIIFTISMFVVYMILYYFGYTKLSFLFMNLMISIPLIYKAYQNRIKLDYLIVFIFLSLQLFLMYRYLY